MTTIGIVACSKLKLAVAAPARDLYAPSPLFSAAAAYCEATYDEWYILSALHGLVHPSQVIEPYDVTLKGMNQAARDRWGSMVLRQLFARGWGSAVFEYLEGPPYFFLHAGNRYRKPFTGAGVYAPLAHQGIGEQLAWYAARRAERAAGQRTTPAAVRLVRA